MKTKLQTWIDENLPERYRKNALLIFDDPTIDHHALTDEKLKELFTLGQLSRNDEMTRMSMEVKALEKALDRVTINVTPYSMLPWWVGVIVILIASAHFYFTYLYVR